MSNLWDPSMIVGLANSQDSTIKEARTMKPPIRMVCADCLRSVELPNDDQARTQSRSHCPYCGGSIDNRLDEIGTLTSDLTDTLLTSVFASVTKPWSETWANGSLGTFDRFQLREVLGDGGFGQVFQAYDPRLDRDVALKVLKQAEPSERVMQRFFREARAAARLTHPNIVSVFDAGCDKGRCWIAYQFIRGRTLIRQYDHQRFDLITSVRMIRSLADALVHAHKQGIYHRDLKPSNILIDEPGQPPLTDFGLDRKG